MNILKIKDFLHLAEKSQHIKDAVEKATEKIEKGEDATRIVSKEIIPLAREHKLYFTTNELISYLKNNKTALTEEELLKASGGISNNVKTALSVTGNIAGLAGMVGGLTTAAPATNKSKEKPETTLIKDLTQNTQNEEHKERRSSIQNLLNQKTSNNKIHITKGELNKEQGGAVLEDVNYSVKKISGLEEERCIVISGFKANNEDKTFTLDDFPPTVEGENWLPNGKATYKGTAFIIPKDIKVNFNNQKWEKKYQEDGSRLFILKDSDAYKMYSNKNILKN